MIEVIAAGLETSVQDFPGRIGFWEQGFPRSGPMDLWSFRLANLLVGNEPGAPALECQFLGPTLRFDETALIAITGADMAPTLDGESIPNWTTVAVGAGQTLALGPAHSGARAYLAVSGGIDVPDVLGSRSTFHMAGIGGLGGRALTEGAQVQVGTGVAGRAPGTTVDPAARPSFPDDKRWTIEVVAGPNDDWIDEAGHARFFGSDWQLTAKSDRTGFRLAGPDWSFSDRATNKLPENGEDPSNILDHGYPFGAINLAGRTPIILVNDGPSAGGFINPYTVASSAFWKLGQSRPGDIYRFRAVSVDEAQGLRRELDGFCAIASLVPPG